MKNWKGVVILLGAWIVSSCTPSVSEVPATGTPVARVYDEVLYEHEVLASIPYDVTPEDSANLRNGIINSWINRKLMVRQAENNLPDDDKDVSLKLEIYRQDLLIYSYQNQLLAQKLDTVVSEEEILDYYTNRQDMFKLSDYIVKVKFAQFDSATFKGKEVEKWIMSEDEEDAQKLEEFCYLHSPNFYLQEEWLYLDEFFKKVRIITYNKLKLLKNPNVQKFFESGNVYYVRIVDYKSKDSLAPLELEKGNIRAIILNNRKLKFLDDLSQDIYQKAKNNQEVEIYIP